MPTAELSPIEFSAADYARLEEVSTQLGACKTAAEKAGKSVHVLSVFLKMTDEKLSAFSKELKERMKGRTQQA